MFFSFRKFTRSLRDAGRGIAYTFRGEQNFRVQIAAALLVVALMLYLPLRRSEQIVLLLLIVMVLSMELLNTAVEKFSDLLVPRLHAYISLVKDAMAAAVLVTSLGSAVIGLIIFWPYLANLFS